jgi:hypothetical protein
MTPRPRIAGLSGILAGVGLAAEGALWATSGWTAETFGDAATALAFLQDNGTHLRAAVFAGAITWCWPPCSPSASPPARIHGPHPGRGDAVVRHYRHRRAQHGPARPMARRPHLRRPCRRRPWRRRSRLERVCGLPGCGRGRWCPVPGSVDACCRLGDRLAARMAGAAGLAWRPGRCRKRGHRVGGRDPLAVLAAGAYLPALTLAIVFRIWAGIRLWRGDAQPALDQGRPGDQISTPSLGS